MMLKNDTNKCKLPMIGLDGERVYFDIQKALPGTFLLPGVVDLEVYEPSTLIETGWIYIRGDLFKGPLPRHPYDMPSSRLTNFSIDLVEAENTSNIVRPIMPPAYSEPFWKGGAPFGKWSIHSMYVPGSLNKSCKYYEIAAMVYRWLAPDDLDETSVFRLKVTIDDPPSDHFSGKLQFLSATVVSASTLRSVGDSKSTGNSVQWRGDAVLGIASLVLLVFCVAVLAYRRSKRIALV